MLLIKYKDGSYETQTEDKLELKVSTLVENSVETVFIAKNKSDIETFKQITK